MSKPNSEQTLLLSVHIYTLPAHDSEEFYLLAKSAGANIFQHLHQQRQRPDPKLFIGAGKVEEIAQLVQQHQINLVIFDHDLSPSQERNLEQALQCRVIDRTGLILDIFAQRAKTHEAKLQVEFAQLVHLSTRLIRGWGNMEQQKGGIGLRGPGETQLETDRRLIRIRMQQLREKIQKVRHTRQQGRSARQKANIATISLVGYTNAGKSTLFNALTRHHSYVADQLFATLDPTVRHMQWTGIGTVVLADTVGFIKNLNHHLVDAFQATLEETLQATLLLHVIDSHDEQHFEHIQAVEKVLQDIGCQVPILRVYNKIDASHETARIVYQQAHQPERVYLSASTGQGLDLLQQAIQERLSGHLHHYTLCLKPQWGESYGKLHSQLHQLNVIQKEHHDQNGDCWLTVYMSQEKLTSLLQRYGLDAHTILHSRSSAGKNLTK